MTSFRSDHEGPGRFVTQLPDVTNRQERMSV